jgi:hypothetical protein
MRGEYNMEMRRSNVNQFGEFGQEVVIDWNEFENDFLKQSLEGVKIINSKGNIRRDVIYDELINEIDRIQLKEIYYIPSLLAIRLLYINGEYDMLYRE